MKFLSLLLTPLLISCTSNTISNSDAEEFTNTAQFFQRMYVEGDENNCDNILEMIYEDIEFSENGETWTKTDMIQYCPYLPEKEVFETISNQKLLTPDLAYDFVSQLYLNEEQDTLSETTSRIWRNLGDGWKIIKMDVVRYRIVN